jgi:hypothetical protein
MAQGIYSASNRHKYYEMFLGSRELPARKADNLTAISEPRQCGIRNNSKRNRLPLPLTKIPFLLLNRSVRREVKTYLQTELRIAVTESLRPCRSSGG